MDVTVAWRSTPSWRRKLLQNVGISTEEVKEKLVRPMARTLVRDVLNELDSESVYNSDKRFEKAEKAREVLTEALAPYGVLRLAGDPARAPLQPRVRAGDPRSQAGRAARASS